MKEGGELGLISFLNSNPSLRYKDFDEMEDGIIKVDKTEISNLAAKYLKKNNSIRVRVG
ncbi:MAG: hypothetical protein ACP5FK_07250 [bacterium]